MSDRADTISTKAVITAAEPQLFVADIKCILRFFCGQARFRNRLHLWRTAVLCAGRARRGAHQPAMRRAAGDRSGLTGSRAIAFRFLTVATAEEIEALFLEFQAAGVTFFQTLKREPWGARDFIIKDPDGNLLLFAGAGGVARRGR